MFGNKKDTEKLQRKISDYKDKNSEAGRIEPDRVDLLTDYQLQIEHAVDLERRECVLFVDASVSATAPYEFYRLQAERDSSYTTHAMSPVAAGLFGGNEAFSLVDAAYAPFFMRMRLLGELNEQLTDPYTENIALWASRLLDRPSVADSVVEDFSSKYIDYFAKRGSWLMQQQVKASSGLL